MQIINNYLLDDSFTNTRYKNAMRIEN